MDKNIALLPMSPKQIMKDDLARASKAKQEKHKSENEIAAKEFEQQHKTNSKSTLLFLMKLNLLVQLCLLLRLIFRIWMLVTMCAMLLCAKKLCFHLRNCLLLCLLLSLTFCRKFMNVFPKDVPRELPLIGGLSIRLT